MIEPAFILVRPQMGENIGAAARAMLNFGLERMRIVAPRDGWPNPAAVAMASGAGRVLDMAGVFPDVPGAIERLKAQFPECSIEQFDGYTFSSGDQENWFWFNVRSSNTEPLLRLNVESNHEASMEKIRDQAIAVIRNG